MRYGAHCDTRSSNIKPSRTGIAEAAERLNTGQKCEGATGSLAIVASGHGPSHPRSLHHGSRLPAMSRRGAASTMEPEEGSRLIPVPLTHLARRFDRRVVSDHPALAISDNEMPSSPAAISEQACTVASFSVEKERLLY